MGVVARGGPLRDRGLGPPGPQTQHLHLAPSSHAEVHLTGRWKRDTSGRGTGPKGKWEGRPLPTLLPLTPLPFVYHGKRTLSAPRSWYPPRPAPLGLVERAPPPHTPHRLVSLRELGTPGTRSHDPGSIFHTLSRCSYWTVPRPPPRLLRPHAQSGAAGLARWAGGAVARGRGRRLAAPGEVGSDAGTLARRQLVDRVVAAVRVQEGHLVLVGRRAAAGLRAHPLPPNAPPLAKPPQPQVVDARSRLAGACAVAEEHRLVGRVAQAQLAHAHFELAQPARPRPRSRARASPPGPRRTARTRGPAGPGRQLAQLHRVRGALQQCTICEERERTGWVGGWLGRAPDPRCSPEKTAPCWGAGALAHPPKTDSQLTAPFPTMLPLWALWGMPVQNPARGPP